MKTSRLMLTILIVVAVVQLAVPASLIVERELALRQGQAYKFKTAPVDPADAFRGRYVALRFEQSSAPSTPGQKLESGQKAYATIAVGQDGFARFSSVSSRPPADQPHLRCHVAWANGSQVQLELPIDRFYLEESRAPAAEQAYWQHNRRGQQDTYAVVRVRNGLGVIENLFIGGQPVAELARRH